MNRVSVALLALAAACGDPSKPSPLEPPGGEDSGRPDTTEASGDSEAPTDTGDCDCDDGLWCNGEETCDEAGACVAGIPPEPVDDGDPCTIVTECDDEVDAWRTELDLSQPACAPLEAVPTVGPLDYAYAYWPLNFRPTETWPATEVVRHFLTGHYGATWDDSTGSLDQLGAFTDGVGMLDALDRDNSELEGFTALSVRYEAGPTASPVVATSFLGTASSAIHRSRTIDGGRFMNRLWVPTVGYDADPSLSGELQVASSPRHLVLTHTVSGGSAAAGTARVVVGGDLPLAFPTVSWLETDRVLTLTDASGEGWLFAVYDTVGNAHTMSIDDTGAVVAEAVGTGSGASVSVLVAPTTALDGDMQAFYIDPESVARVQSTLLDRDGNAVAGAVNAPWDPALGAFRASMGTLQDAGGPARADYSGDPGFHHWHGRHHVQITSSAADTLSIPVAMHGSDQMSWYIVGGAPSLRDLDGEPVGVPLQISKNWHEGRPNNWYHLYTHPTVEAGADHTLELTMASSKWGDVYAASHAQLSLIGWSEAGGHWDESALGAFGESITYDPDVNLGRAMQDDVRPFLVDADGQWNWTGNVGGAEFLRYATESEWYWMRRIARVRSAYTAVGPNLTDVTYAGITTDGRIEARATPHLVASDDLVRTYVHLSFTFLEDVTYDRLAFFQVAADNYADNGFSMMAWGNASGVEADTPVRTSTTRGYDSDTDRGIALAGDDPWVFLYDNTISSGSLPENLGNVGFVVRQFEADIGGTRVTTPHISLHQTYNGGYAQTSFELSLPYEDGAPWCGAPCGGQTNFIPAGSTVEAIVEYLVPPAGSYYGDSDWLTAFDSARWNTADMMLELASKGALDVTAAVGTLVSTYPIEVASAEGITAGELTVQGGLGYHPVSFSGLVRHDGWKLQRRTDDDWETLDASSSVGNDWWQATHDARTDTWTLTYSVPVGEPQELRLVWEPS